MYGIKSAPAIAVRVSLTVARALGHRTVSGLENAIS